VPSSVPLGASRYARYEDGRARLEPGSTLLMYTDGVVERRGESLDAGLERLERAACSAGADPAALCRGVVDTLLPGGAARDDAALLAARVLELGVSLELRLAAEIDSIPPLRRVLGRWLEEAGAGVAEADEITLACSEACANAVEHAYAPGPAAIEVSAELSPPGEVVIRVHDSGRWRPPRGEHRGRGMLLMEGLMESVDVDAQGTGTTVTLSRRLAEPSR
jgi:anti-sigma regulatory factor (Ser/Thr protein kinase)